MFRCKLTPSFCNYWPEISFIVNGKELWHNFVDKEQIVEIDFPLEEENLVEIVYLNKRLGPDAWDTKVDSEGKITEDQHCIVSDIYIAGSRCDFVLESLPYLNDSGTINERTYGFMSHKGRYKISFPKDVYAWIVNNRNSLLIKSFSSKGESSLAYFESYALNSTSKIPELLEKINSLLEELSSDKYK